MSAPLDLARAQDGYGRGATLVLNRLEKFWPPCTALAKEVEAALQVYTSLNMYFTPPKSRGFDPHFDYEDVFIVQVQGVKRWRVWEPDAAVGQERLPLNEKRSRPTKSAVPTTTPQAVVLNPGAGAPRFKSWTIDSPEDLTLQMAVGAGDVLYIPRGWPHVAETEGTAPSIHMTMTLHVQDFTWESLLRFCPPRNDLRCSPLIQRLFVHD